MTDDAFAGATGEYLASGTRVRVAEAVADAMHEHRPVVALESSVLSQGLPVPANREAAERMMAAVAESGGVGAITAVSQGVPTLGLEPRELERFLRRDGVRKVAARDIALAVAQRVDGATTVAASLCIASTAGIDVFATGGIGGVHRDAPFDESGDLVELARTPMVVICAGAKSILDLPATLERLETLGVTVLGYRTDELPGFFSHSTGLGLPSRVDTVEEIAAVYRANRRLGRRQATLVVQPPPAEVALPQGDIDDAVSSALEKARSAGIHGAAVTPFLLGAVVEATGGRSLLTNLGLLEENARLAGRIAAALTTSSR